MLATLTKPEVVNAFKLTLLTTAVATVVNTVFGLAFAVVLAARSSGARR